LVVDARWRVRIGQLLERNAALQGSSVMRVITAEGFDGSYQTVTRYLRDVRGPTRGNGATTPDVTMRIETGPAEEFQFDWSDCNSWARRWGWDHELHCFGALLCWCRRKYWWFAPSIDQAHTLHGLVGFFEDTGGVCGVGRTDRMGQLGHSTRGKGFAWYPIVLEFARHYGFSFTACASGDAARKGKIERPFRDLKAGFLAEMDLDPPGDIAELNRRVGVWLATHVHAVVHRTIKVRPDERFAIEAPMLHRLPAVRFDTARRQPRRVGRFPMIEWDTVFYSAPPETVGTMVECRQPVDGGILEIRFAGRLVATHALAPAGSEPQWIPEHKAATEAITLGRHGRHLRVVDDETPTASASVSVLDLGDGDYDIDLPDLAIYERIGPHPQLDVTVEIATHDDMFLGCGCTGGPR
jgi:transposase